MQRHWMLFLKYCVFLWVFLITGCSNSGYTSLYRYPNDPIKENLTMQQQAMLVSLDKAGIQVIKQGMKFTFVIPVDCFFSKDTGELKSHRYADLDILSHFIDSYLVYFARIQVSVTGYADKVWLMPERQKLSLHYARAVAGVLEEDGLDSAILHVRGEAAKHPIASNAYPMGTAFNRRVEVIIDAPGYPKMRQPIPMK